MPQPPPGRPSGPIPRPGQPRTAATPAKPVPPAPPSRPVARPAAPAAPAAPPSGGGTRRIQTPDAPQKTRTSEVPQTAPRTPAPPAPGTQRISKPAAAAPGTQRIEKPAAPASGSQRIEKPAAPGTQRVSRPAAPASQRTPNPGAEAAAPAPEPPAAPGASPAGPNPSKKFLRPTKMQQAIADAASAPPEKKAGKGKILFNIGIILSIPLSIVVIGFGVWKNKNKGKGIGDMWNQVKGSTVGETPQPPPPKINPDEEALKLSHAKLVKAQTNFAEAELERTPEERRRTLYEEAKTLIEEVFTIVAPISEKPEYSGEGYEWITKDLTQAAQLKRALADRLKALQPEEVKPPAAPNTAALGALAGWNGTTQKLAILFLTKSASPSDPAMSTSSWMTSELAEIKLVDLEPGRVFEFARGSVKEGLDKLQGEERDAKAKELTAGVMVFEGAKLKGSLSYILSMNGVFFRDQLSKFSVRIHDDRGTGAFQEYHDLVLQAIGSPSKGKESVTSGLSSWDLLWTKEGVVYRLSAIGNPGGMDITITAFNEPNHKAFCEALGEVDPFLDTNLEAWDGRSATFPPTEAPK